MAGVAIRATEIDDATEPGVGERPGSDRAMGIENDAVGETVGVCRLDEAPAGTDIDGLGE